jgi:hypothetical protein
MEPEQQSTGSNQPASRPTRSLPRSWLWYFLLLAVAGVFALTIPLVYNLRQQLQPEQFEAAQARWKQHGPADYDLNWETKQNDDPRPDEYRVVVRGGQVQMVYVDGQLQMARELAAALGAAVGPAVTAAAPNQVPRKQLSGYTVEGMFHTIGKDLEKNAESGGRNFATATFDARDGHPVRYVYRVKHSPERLEWNVKLLRP